jgi:hypothetical protein
MKLEIKIKCIAMQLECMVMLGLALDNEKDHLAHRQTIICHVLPLLGRHGLNKLPETHHPYTQENLLEV